ncbi:3'-5' exonuclease [Spirosoma harenae]
MLQLKRPIVFIDLETTGLDREKDRIVQIGLCKLMPDFTIQDWQSRLINPERSIPAETTKIHGITDFDVFDQPRFKDEAGPLFEFLVGCDVGGFNSNWFDIPLLFNEFARCGIHWNYQAFHMIDVGNLFKIKEPRNLSNAVRFYCDREFMNAHNAADDIKETVNVFMAQLARYSDLPDSVDQLALFTNYNCKVADISGKFVYNADGVLLLNFGKYKGNPAKEHLDFVHWMYYKADFAPDTNAICEQLLGGGGINDDDDEGIGF